jgi:MerR family transcriptional regulator, light-induced transcriptional regulator
VTPLLAERLSGVRELRHLQPTLSRRATDRFLQRHPDWLDRYGERARIHGEQDAAFHIDFIAAALAAGTARPFEDYVRWAASLLEARGIPRGFLLENLDDIAAAFNQHAGTLLVAQADRVLAAGAHALEGAEEPVAELEADARLFCDATLAGRRASAVGVAQEALRRHGDALSVYCGVIEASQQEIGRRWARTMISVADEHRATAVAQFVLARLYEELPFSSEARGRCLIAGVTGERHQFGPNMIADALDSDGWDVDFLGTDLPAEALIATVAQTQPHVIGLSATMPANLPNLLDLVTRLRSQFDARIVVGGRALCSAGHSWHEAGADAYAADVWSAVTACRRFSAV